MKYGYIGTLLGYLTFKAALYLVKAEHSVLNEMLDLIYIHFDDSFMHFTVFKSFSSMDSMGARLFHIIISVIVLLLFFFIL